MDRLADIFRRQKAFDDLLEERRSLPDWSPDEWTQRESLAIVCELAEVIEETNHRWREDERPVDRDRVVAELVDVLNLFTSLCLNWGVTAQELYERYLARNRANLDRLRGEGGLGA